MPKKEKKATQQPKDQTGFMGHVCVARALFSLKLCTKYCRQLDSPIDLSHIQLQTLGKQMFVSWMPLAAELWLQERANQGVIRDVFCPSAPPEGCGEQSCVSGDLLRQPSARAREPLCAAGDADEPTGQDKVSASCSKHSLLPTSPMSNFSNRKKGKHPHVTCLLYIFYFWKQKMPPNTYRCVIP